MSKKTELKYPASVVVHCPTGPVHACEEHAKQIQGLMSFMAAHTVCTKSDGKHECSNCVDENK